MFCLLIKYSNNELDKTVRLRFALVFLLLIICSKYFFPSRTLEVECS
jgi:hypothetical protein